MKGLSLNKKDTMVKKVIVLRKWKKSDLVAIKMLSKMIAMKYRRNTGYKCTL
jgi:hypothetical protein